MAAHRGHWTAGLRGLWCLGGGRRRKGPPEAQKERGLDCAGYITRHSRLSPMRFNARSRTSAAIYPQKCCPFSRLSHWRVSIPLCSHVSSRRRTALLLARSSFLGEDWTRRIVELVVTSRFFSSWGNIVVIVTFVIIVFGNISEIWDYKILLLRNLRFFF